MLRGVLSGSLGMAPVLTLNPEDIEVVSVHHSDGDETKVRVSRVEFTAWRGEVMGFATRASDEPEAFGEFGPVLTTGGRVLLGLSAANSLREKLTAKHPTLAFPLRLGRSSAFYSSFAHVTLTKSGAEALSVWLDKCLELGVL